MKRPLYATISGVAVVTIPAEHYAELLDCKRRLGETTLSNNIFLHPCRSRIERDAEVANFLAHRVGLAPLSEVLRQCKREFGKQRTPQYRRPIGTGKGSG